MIHLENYLKKFLKLVRFVIIGFVLTFFYSNSNKYILKYDFYNEHIKRTYQRNEVILTNESNNKAKISSDKKEILFINPVSIFDREPYYNKYFNIDKQTVRVIQDYSYRSPFFNNHSFIIYEYTIMKNYPQSRLIAVSNTHESYTISDSYINSVKIVSRDNVNEFNRIHSYKIALFNRIIADENIDINSIEMAIDYIQFFLKIYYLSEYKILGGYKYGINYFGYNKITKSQVRKEKDHYKIKLLIGSHTSGTEHNELSYWKIRLRNDGKLVAGREYIFDYNGENIYNIHSVENLLKAIRRYYNNCGTNNKTLDKILEEIESDNYKKLESSLKSI